MAFNQDSVRCQSLGQHRSKTPWIHNCCISLVDTAACSRISISPEVPYSTSTTSNAQLVDRRFLRRHKVGGSPIRHGGPRMTSPFLPLRWILLLLTLSVSFAQAADNAPKPLHHYVFFGHDRERISEPRFLETKAF